jgi:hypothetical protein
MGNPNRHIGIAAVLLAVAGCGEAPPAPPTGNATAQPASVVTASPAPAPVKADPAADEAAIRKVIARTYAVAEGTDNEAIWRNLSRRFAAAWRECYRLRDAVSKQAGGDGETYGICLDDAGSFIPGQDYEEGVAARTHRAAVTLDGADAARATVTMQLFADAAAGPAVTRDLLLVREGGEWRIDDLLDKELAEGSYRKALAAGAKELAGN